MRYPELDRRTVLAGLLAGGALAVGARLGLLTPAAARATPLEGPYGPLRPALDRTTGLPLLRLPADFTYASFGWAGDALDDGFVTPGGHDGMAVVRASGDRVWLVRNHELASGVAFGPPTMIAGVAGALTGCIRVSILAPGRT